MRYEGQAALRKRNSAIGVAAANKVLNNKCSSNITQIEQRRAARLSNMQRYYSTDEVEEIMNL